MYLITTPTIILNEKDNVIKAGTQNDQGKSVPSSLIVRVEETWFHYTQGQRTESVDKISGKPGSFAFLAIAANLISNNFGLFHL